MIRSVLALFREFPYFCRASAAQGRSETSGRRPMPRGGSVAMLPALAAILALLVTPASAQQRAKPPAKETAKEATKDGSKDAKDQPARPTRLPPTTAT